MIRITCGPRYLSDEPRPPHASACSRETHRTPSRGMRLAVLTMPVVEQSCGIGSMLVQESGNGWGGLCAAGTGSSLGGVSRPVTSMFRCWR